MDPEAVLALPIVTIADAIGILYLVHRLEPINVAICAAALTAVMLGLRFWARRVRRRKFSGDLSIGYGGWPSVWFMLLVTPPIGMLGGRELTDGNYGWGAGFSLLAVAGFGLSIWQIRCYVTKESG